MTAVTACRTCGTEPVENARFCHGCGSPVAQGDTRLGRQREIRACAARHTRAERQRGTEMLAEVHDLCLQQKYFRIHLPAVEICAPRERFRVVDFGEAIPAMRQAVDELFRGGQVVQGIWGAVGFAEALLKRGAKGDVVEAQEVIDNLAKLPDDVKRGGA